MEDKKWTSIVIYGTGIVAEKIYKELTEKMGSDSVCFFLESLLSKKEFCNKEVHDLSFLDKIQKNNYIYYLGTYTNADSMKAELLHRGILDENIIEVEDFGLNTLKKHVMSVNRIMLFPEFQNPIILEKIADEILYLFPGISNTGLYIEAAGGDFVSNYEMKHIQAVEKLNPDSNTVILVWDKAFLKETCIQGYKKVLCIDRAYFDIIDIRIFLRLNHIFAGEIQHNKISEISKRNMEKLLGKYQKAYIVGNGPSCIDGIQKLPENEPTLRLACNFFVKNQKYMNILRPNLYLIADEVMASKNVESYISMVMEYVEKENCLLVVPYELASAYVIRYPSILEKIIAVDLDAKEICFPTVNNLRVYRKAYNVITAFAIPLASALCNDIYIMGCDGMKTGTKDPWEYADGLSVDVGISKNDEKNNWQVQYYEQHVRYMEELICYGEEKGKRYHSVAKSFIPVLKRLEDY